MTIDYTKVKMVGQRRRRSPEECLGQAWELQQFGERFARFPRPRGFVFKARTWSEYEAWRKAQSNPRLW